MLSLASLKKHFNYCTLTNSSSSSSSPSRRCLAGGLGTTATIRESGKSIKVKHIKGTMTNSFPFVLQAS